MSSLTIGWKMLKVGDIAQKIAVRLDPTDAKTDIYVGMEHLDPSALHLRQWGHPSDAPDRSWPSKRVMCFQSPLSVLAQTRSRRV